VTVERRKLSKKGGMDIDLEHANVASKREKVMFDNKRLGCCVGQWAEGVAFHFNPPTTEGNPVVAVSESTT
jgi:hypothetical protein